MAAAGKKWVACRFCDAMNRPGLSCCYLCGEPLPESEPPAASDLAVRRATDCRPIGLGPSNLLMLLLIAAAWLAVCIGVAYQAPGLAVLLVVITVPAFVRARVAVSRSQEGGRELPALVTAFVFIATLVGSLVTVILIGAGALFIAFCVLCGQPCSPTGGSNASGLL